MRPGLIPTAAVPLAVVLQGLLSSCTLPQRIDAAPQASTPSTVNSVRNPPPSPAASVPPARANPAVPPAASANPATPVASSPPQPGLLIALPPLAKPAATNSTNATSARPSALVPITSPTPRSADTGLRAPSAIASGTPPPTGPRNDAHYALGMPLPNLPSVAAPAALVATDADIAAGPTGDDTAALLARILNRAGLNDNDLQRLRVLQQQLDTGDPAALPALQDMDAELAAAFMLYTVKPGDHLWTIAARTETYGNRSLWPLIWNANRAVLPSPEPLPAAQTLKVPLHPTADEAGAALAWSRTHTPAP